MAKICQMCGVSNDDAIEFCSACGSELTPGGAAKSPPSTQQAKPAAQSEGTAKTMMFGQAQPAKSAQAPPAKPAQAQPVSPAQPQPAKPATDQAGGNKTMMFGQVQAPPQAQPVSPAQAQPVSPAQAQPISPAQAQPASAPTEAPRNELGTAQTMIDTAGAAAEPPAAGPGTPKGDSAPAAQPRPAPVAGSGQKTVFGMPSVSTDKMPSKKSSKPPMAKAVTSGAPPAAAPGGPSNRTMLGMVVPPSQKADTKRGITPPPAEPEPQPKPAAAEPTPAPTQSAEAKTVDQPVMGESKVTPKQATSTAASPTTDDDQWWDEEEQGGGERKGGLIIGLIVAMVVVILAGAGVLVYLFVFDDGQSVRPQVFSTPDGKAVATVFSFPAAPPGTTLQLGGQTVQVVNGQARIDLPMTQLQIGANEIQVLYTEPGRPAEQHSFPIVLRHLITTDMTGLVGAQPFVVVNFRVIPGIALTVEGQTVQPVNGAYAHRVELTKIAAVNQSTAENLVYGVSFQITDAKGLSEQGQHVLTIPQTRLQIDRPARNAIVDTETVTCAGITEEGAKVTVNGKAVGITAVGFNTSVPLPAMGEHSIQITARAPNKAPRTQTVKVTRIGDLKGAIATWSEELDPRLDYPTLARSPNAHVNKKAKVTGRVVNINTEKGVTVFLLYMATSCPKGAKCAIYVVYRGETDAGMYSWVDVYGKVAGSRAVDLPSGEKLEVPAINADFVVKSAAQKGKRRRRR